MSTIIIYAHPYRKSFNKAILDNVTDRLASIGESYTVADLYADGFNPAFSESELSQFNSGVSPDPLVRKYQSMLSGANKAIFIFPIWWSEAPAMLKGFIDKVMTPGFGYHESESGLTPGLDIARTLVVSTSAAPTEVFAPYFDGYFVSNVLSAIGFNNVEWLNCPGMGSNTLEERQSFISKVLDRL